MKMNDGKRFFVTERQLDELKKLLERYEGMPEEVSLDEDLIADEYIPIVEPMVESSVEAALAEPNRDLKFWIEDVEGQEPDELKDDLRWRNQSEEPAPEGEPVLTALPAWKQPGRWIFSVVWGRLVKDGDYWRPVGGAPKVEAR